MSTSWTQEQENVIRCRDCDMLVSAAAGSGKTAVLVERIIRLITEGENPPDIDRILVVTFTHAAASEMRERIRTALEKKLEDDPDNVHLQKQVTLISHALITTIHSFCLDVVRSSFTDLIEPGFRIADESETILLKEEILGRVMEEAHGDDALEDTIRNFASGRDDSEAAKQVMKLFEYSEAYPWPRRWRHDALLMYEPESERELEEQGWMKILLARCRKERDEACLRIRSLLALTDRPGGPAAYRKTLEDDLTRFEQADLRDYENTRISLSRINEWGALGRIGKKDVVDPDLKKMVKDRRDDLKAEWKKRYDRLFSLSLEQVAYVLSQCKATVSGLVMLADRFEELYLEEKRERGIADFSDLEHYALQLLVSRQEDGFVPSKTAESYAKRFAYVMIDEYQDSNLVQEYILKAVSGAGNRFMVGDVKQSIYRFRQARPELFMEKYASYTRAQAGEQKGELLFELHRNFRSRPQILKSVNRIFEQIMAEDIGGVDYTEEVFLHPGASFPQDGAEEAGGEDPYSPVLYLTREEDDMSEDLTGRDREAMMAAGIIQDLVGKFPVTDRETGGVRTAKYGDIAVLLRTMKGWSDNFLTVFAESGIPAFSCAGDGYFDTLEIRTILCCLRLLDNPRQDIPLAAVLRSPVGGFSDSDLALIRAAHRKGSFFDACKSCLEEESDLPERIISSLRSFFDRIDMLRAEVPFTPIHALIWRVLDLTGYGDYVLAMPGGRQRRANIQMLVEKAIAFEQGSCKGLFHFLRYIDKLGESPVQAPEAPLAAEGEDVVRIMSIHKSKGLEFPIVLVCGMGKHFNRMETRSPLTLHQDLGIGCRYLDRERHTSVTPLPKQVMMQLLETDDLGEELRVLYVAMTRAREKLIMTGSVPDTDKAMERWEDQAKIWDRTMLPRYVRSGAQSFLDWVMPAVLKGGSGVKLGTRSISEEAREDISVHKTPLFLCDGASEDPAAADQLLADWEKVKSRFLRAREAAAHRITDIPGAVSVSRLKHEAMQQYEPLAEEMTGLSDNSASGSGGAQRGTMYHSFLEFFDYTGMPEKEKDFEDYINRQLESMVNCGKIQKVVSLDMFDAAQIRTFLCSPAGRKMRGAAEKGRLHREQPFVLGVEARQVDPRWNSEETVLVQGIIDAWFTEEDGKIVLIDYKTDRVAGLPDPEEELLRRYRVQLKLYQEALERLTGRTVKDTWIYSFDLGDIIPIEG